MYLLFAEGERGGHSEKKQERVKESESKRARENARTREGRT